MVRRAWMAVALAAVVVAMGCTTSTISAMVCDNGVNGGIGPITEVVDADLTVPSEAECNFGPTGLVNGDVQVEGNVNGNIKVNGGEVTVHGRVDGNIEASTEDMITVTGTVLGNIENEGNGDVLIVEPGSIVAGNIVMAGDGNVTLKLFSKVAGNVKLQGHGNVIVGSSSTVQGNIEKEGDGNVTIQAGGTVAGNVKCGGSGCNLSPAP